MRWTSCSGLRRRERRTGRYVLLDPAAKWHIWAAVGALAVGPLQFSSRLRSRYGAAHRWLGRYCVAAAITGGAAGTLVAKHAATPLGTVGVALLGVLWITSTVLAVVVIRQRKVQAHRKWMTISYALCYGAVILRSVGPLLTTYGVSLSMANTVEMWSWVGGLVFVRWLFGLEAQRAAKPAAASASRPVGAARGAD